MCAKCEEQPLQKCIRALVEWWQWLKVLPKNPNAEVPQRVLNLVGGVLPGWDGEDLVQFLKGEFLEVRDDG